MFTINCHEHSEYISNSIKKLGFWEGYTSEVLQELLLSPRLNPDRTVFIDVGANIGYFSLFAAARHCKVLAFEPIEENYNLFMQSIQKNGFEKHIQLQRAAVGDSCDDTILNMCHHNMGMCSSRDLGSFASRSVTVPTVTLDSFISQACGCTPQAQYIVKIDVEWMELQVLRGMRELLETSVRYVLIEVSNYVKEIFDIFRAAEFTCVVDIGSDGDLKKKMLPQTSYLQDKKYYNNIDVVEKNMLGMQTKGGNPQKMYLFMRACDALCDTLCDGLKFKSPKV